MELKCEKKLFILFISLLIQLIYIFFIFANLKIQDFEILW